MANGAAESARLPRCPTGASDPSGTSDYTNKVPSHVRVPMTTPANSFEQLTTLFALGREVASVLDLEELLHKIPQLIARLTRFNAFAVYLLDTTRDELLIAYAVGYPEDVARSVRFKVGQGLVGAAVAAGQPLIVNDVHAEPQYI